MTDPVENFRRILVPLDFRIVHPGDETQPAILAFEVDGQAMAMAPGSERALEFAAALSRKTGAELSLLHVVPPLADSPMYHGPVPLPAAMMQEVRDRAMDRAMQLMHFVRDRVCADLAVDAIVRPGVPREVVLEEANRQSVNLIVMAASSRGRLVRFVVGSTTDQVIRQASCPVVVIPPE